MDNNNNRKEDENYKDDDDDNIILWEDLEECEILEIPITTTTNLTLRQYVSNDSRWGIHSSVWEGGLALLAYIKKIMLLSSLEDPIMTNKKEDHHHQPKPKNLLLSNHQSHILSSLFLSSSSPNNNGSTENVIIDLGSGTGIVGLGIVQLLLEQQQQQQQQQSKNSISSSTSSIISSPPFKVLLTDLSEALPLLQDNVQRNFCNNKNQNKKKIIEEEEEEICLVYNVTWGEPISDILQQQLVVVNNNNNNKNNNNNNNKNQKQIIKKNIILVGADIIYRPTLFPLLCNTIIEFFNNKYPTTVSGCILACHSIRTHLVEFFQYLQSTVTNVNNTTTTTTTCNNNNNNENDELLELSVELCALVQLPKDQTIMGVQLSSIQTKETNPNTFPKNLSNAPKRFGLVYIIQITRK